MSTKIAAVARAAAASNPDGFALSELIARGCTGYAIKKAIDAGLLKPTKAVTKTGQRGRPARLHTLTAKGRKVAEA